MNVSIDEHRFGGLRWIVLRGPDREAFRALGEHARDEIAALTQAWPLLARLPQHVCDPPGSDRLNAVRQASALRFPEVWEELAAFAAGAAVPFEDLALLNFRGDLGPVAGGIGCSDLAWRRQRSVIGHNEDGAPENVGQCALLTVALDDLPSITAFWCPGFLPSNAFAVTADGLVWNIDHLPVSSPGDGAARHFVGRGLQRSARTLDAAIDYLRTNPSAGGFAYTIGDRTCRTASAAIRRPAIPPPRCARSSLTSPQVRPSSPPGTTSRKQSRCMTWPKGIRIVSASSARRDHARPRGSLRSPRRSCSIGMTTCGFLCAWSSSVPR